ncbi:hypothetical protein RRG08_009118 [Elysia crispata]|uniref:Uncharacterized protein n=1 Tax=Elysia crispata TaxID=231223 RepID=A0AAE0YP98_9GAST|nr:hypothetical protein RRG08_009118 [Elysia crispata]
MFARGFDGQSFDCLNLSNHCYWSLAWGEASLNSLFDSYRHGKFEMILISIKMFSLQHPKDQATGKNCVFLLQNYNAWLEFKAGGSCLYSNNNDAGRLFNSREESLYNSTGH